MLILEGVGGMYGYELQLSKGETVLIDPFFPVSPPNNQSCELQLRLQPSESSLPTAAATKAVTRVAPRALQMLTTLAVPTAAERPQTNKNHHLSGCLVFCGCFHLFLQLCFHADALP